MQQTYATNQAHDKQCLDIIVESYETDLRCPVTEVSSF
jgi:hypothetical protein